MKILKAGDIRQEGDQVRQLVVKYNYFAENYGLGCWMPVRLIGWEILPADLFNAEFRRPNGRR